MFSEEYKAMKLEERVARLSASPKSIKCPGVLRKLRRQQRNIQKF